MLFARILLTVTGLVFFVHGLVCFIHPATIGIESGLAMPTPSSVIEVRAEYGGLPIALGLFFLAAALQEDQKSAPASSSCSPQPPATPPPAS